MPWCGSSFQPVLPLCVGVFMLVGGGKGPQHLPVLGEKWRLHGLFVKDGHGCYTLQVDPFHGRTQ